MLQYGPIRPFCHLWAMEKPPDPSSWVSTIITWRGTYNIIIFSLMTKIINLNYRSDDDEGKFKYKYNIKDGGLTFK